MERVWVSAGFFYSLLNCRSTSISADEWSGRVTRLQYLGCAFLPRYLHSGNLSRASQGLLIIAARVERPRWRAKQPGVGGKSAVPPRQTQSAFGCRLRPEHGWK